MPPLPELPGVTHADHALPTGVTLHVAEAGDPAAPPVLAVHGWPQHWWMWREVIAALAPTRRVICPDLRGLGWSGQPADGDFAKGRFADDLLALLDVLGIERAGLLGHDWGGWACWLVALRAPARVERLMALSIVHPWPPRRASALNAWRIAYQPVLAAPLLGPAAVVPFARAALGRSMDAASAAIYADVLDDPARAEASSRIYRHFLLRDLPGLAQGRGVPAGVDLPVKMLLGRHDPAIHPSQLGDLARHAPGAELELVDGGHFIVDEQPELIADRARTWFA
jgi:pimeloyl-ACP methyl ester carboxylesterase